MVAAVAAAADLTPGPTNRASGDRSAHPGQQPVEQRPDEARAAGGERQGAQRRLVPGRPVELLVGGHLRAQGIGLGVQQRGPVRGQVAESLQALGAKTHASEQHRGRQTLSTSRVPVPVCSRDLHDQCCGGTTREPEQCETIASAQRRGLFPHTSDARGESLQRTLRGHGPRALRGWTGLPVWRKAELWGRWDRHAHQLNAGTGAQVGALAHAAAGMRRSML